MKRLISLLLAGILIFSLVPAQVLATDGAEDAAPSEEATAPTVMLMTDPVNNSDGGDSEGDDDADPSEQAEAEPPDAPKSVWTVTFKQDDGSILKTVEVEDDNLVSQYTPPEDPNFVFVGWYTERDSKWNFETDTVKGKDITLTARWAIKVIFDTMGGTPDYFVQGANSDGTISQPENPEKSEYKFAGWYNGNKLWDFKDTVNTTTTLTAK